MRPERKAQLAPVCRAMLSDLLEQCPSLLWASVSTSDGVEVAAIGDVANDKLSVMTGTMLALANGIVSEAALGTGRNIILDASGGRVVILSVEGTRDNLVLAGMAEPGTTLGLLLALCTKTCEAVREVAQQPDPPRVEAPPAPPTPEPPRPPLKVDAPKPEPSRPARSWPWRGFSG